MIASAEGLACAATDVAERDLLVDALVAAQDQLSALVSLMALPSSSLTHDVLVDRVLAQCALLVGADVVWLEREGGVPTRRWITPGTAHLDEQASPTESSSNLVGCRADDRGSWARAPFAHRRGGAVLVWRSAGPDFTTGDLRLLDTVAGAFEQLLDWADLHEKLLRQATLEREHQTASALAQAVLPIALPSLPGVELFADCRPAARTGGDFWVVERIGDAVWFAVGDVAGKGLPAATIMIQALAAVRVAFLSAAEDDPAGALRAVTRELRPYLMSVGSFVTLAIGVHVRSSGVVRLANAGHSPVVYRPTDGAAAVLVPASAPPVGVDTDLAPTTICLPFTAGCSVVVGTDGLVEQPDPHGELFGYGRFLDLCGSLAQPRLARELLAAVEAHACGVAPADDRTLVLVGLPAGVSDD